MTHRPRQVLLLASPSRAATLADALAVPAFAVSLGAEQGQADPDLVLLADGEQAWAPLDALRQRSPQLPVVLCSRDPQVIARAVDRYGIDRLLVDEDPQRLRAALLQPIAARAALDGQRLEQLTRTARLAALGRLVGPLAHQINSPLTGILIFAESLTRTLPEGEPQQDAAEIQRGALRCRALTQTLLRAARRPARDEVEPRVDVGSLVAEVEPLVVHRIETAGLTLTIEIESGLPPAAVAPAALEQVLLELIDNACLACGRGAALIIGARRVAPAELEIWVHDSGQGMTPAQLRRAIEPFYTTRSRAAGLGLSCCVQLLGEVGGSLELESTAGEGTCARARLPVAG